MSVFINQKEEVLQLELTAYGKHLFSRGEFSPVYYAFYDSDILYDGEYGGITETQNDVSSRIKNTQRLSIQTNFTSSIDRSEGDITVSTAEFENLTYSSVEFLKPIGTSDRWSDFAPVWNIQNMSGSILFSGSATYKSLDALPTISSSIATSYLLSERPQGEGEEPLREYRIIDQGSLRIDIQELHSVFKEDGNFDIEIYRQPLDNEGEPQGDLQRLRFIDPMSMEAEELYSQQEAEVFAATLNRGDGDIETDFPTLNSSYTEYFLSVRVDDEIRDQDTGNIGEASYFPGTSNSVDESCAPNLPRGGGN